MTVLSVSDYAELFSCLPQTFRNKPLTIYRNTAAGMILKAEINHYKNRATSVPFKIFILSGERPRVLSNHSCP